MRDEYLALPHGLGNRYLRREPSASADHPKIMSNRQGQDHRFGVGDNWLDESISAAEVEAFMQRLGLARVRGMATPTTIGFFGSGCDEYLYRRTS
jgi:hypothetical protein